MSSFTPYTVELNTRSEWVPPQYPPRTPNGRDGQYGTEAEPSVHYTDSPKFNADLHLRSDTLPRPLSPTNRRPSRWRAVVNRSRRFARFTYATCLILVLVIWGVINVIFTMREHNHETKYSQADLKDKGAMLQKIQNEAENNTAQFIFMKGRLRGFDPQKSVLSVEWEGLLVDGSQKDLRLGAADGFRLNLAVFRDVATERDLDTERLLASQPNGTEAEHQQFRVFQPAPLPVGFIGRSPHDSINTDIGVGQLDGGDLWSQPGFAYPYDRSEGKITFAMSNNDTVRASNSSQGSFLVSIMGAVITDSILNYQTDISNTAVCEEPAGCQLDITLQLQRPGLVKAIVILTVFINWLITLSICILTGEAIILERMYILSGSDILSICLTSLFALPSVRSVLPGAPPFGCLIDMVGILPNVILISLCTTAFAVSKARNRINTPA